MTLTNLLAAMFILVVFIVILAIAAVNQIEMAGIKVKDFWSFINANENLDRLYEFAKRYDKMSPQEQVIYLAEAERMFDAFDKIPKTVWEDEEDKYSDVLDTYKDIRIMRWNESQALVKKEEKESNNIIKKQMKDASKKGKTESKKSKGNSKKNRK